MTTLTRPAAMPMQLLNLPGGLAIHQGLTAAAKLGVADLLAAGVHTTEDLARRMDVNEPALYRLLRALASQGVFEETSSRKFVNTTLSEFLRTGVSGSVRPLLVFEATEFYYPRFGKILDSIKTGRPVMANSDGTDAFESLRQNPELARIFDDAMTSLSELDASAIASAYDFNRWGSLIDVGGGNGVLLAAIIRKYPGLRGVLADQPHVLDRARQRGFLGGELEQRSTMQDCNFLSEIPSGCKACLLKNVLVNWDDEHALTILLNCRRVVPNDGALLVVDFTIADGNLPSRGKFVDLIMLVLYGGRVRSAQEHGNLLDRAGFRLNQVLPIAADLTLMEAIPV